MHKNRISGFLYLHEIDKKKQGVASEEVTNFGSNLAIARLLTIKLFA
jgi:hypothetical protein